MEGIIQDIVVAKLNADQYPDLALTPVRGEVISLLNTGFERFEVSFTDTIASAQSVAALDINADGATDLMVAGAADDENYGVQAYVNEGQGAFRRGSSYLPGTFPLLLAADLNHDDLQDLVVADGVDSHASVLFVKKSGGGERPQSYRLPAPPVGLATVDADRDGELDLAVAVEGWSPGVVVFRNRSGGAGN